ncbi:MAG: hypothetical protein AB7E47_02285 [Desulfovibrionaceae bacterium]
MGKRYDADGPPSVCPDCGARLMTVRTEAKPGRIVRTRECSKGCGYVATTAETVKSEGRMKPRAA